MKRFSILASAAAGIVVVASAVSFARAEQPFDGWQGMRVIPLEGRAERMFVADLGHDGRDDIVVVNPRQSRLDLYRWLPGADRTRVDAGVARGDHAAGATHHADAVDHPAAGHRGLGVRVVDQPAGQRGQLQPGGAGIEQAGHPLARQQLPALVEQRLGPGRGRGRAGLERAQPLDQREHAGSALGEGGRRRIDA